MDCLEASRCVKRRPWELYWCTETVRPTQSVATNSSKARPFPVLLQTKDENYPQEFVRNLLKSIRPNVFGTSDFLDQAHFLFTILNPVWVVRITLDYEIL